MYLPDFSAKITGVLDLLKYAESSIPDKGQDNFLSLNRREQCPHELREKCRAVLKETRAQILELLRELNQ